MTSIEAAGSAAAYHAQNVQLLDKALDLQKLEGEAAIQLIESSDQVAVDASAPRAAEGGKGSSVDVHA